MIFIFIVHPQLSNIFCPSVAGPMCKYVLGSFDEKKCFCSTPYCSTSVLLLWKNRARVRILNQGILISEFKGRKHALTSKDGKEFNFSLKEVSLPGSKILTRALKKGGDEPSKKERGSPTLIWFCDDSLRFTCTVQWSN